MSRVTKCDRCGSVFNPTDWFIAYELESKTVFKRLNKIRTAVSNWLGFTKEGSAKHYDLCPSCQRDLLKFINGEDEQEEAEMP